MNLACRTNTWKLGYWWALRFDDLWWKKNFKKKRYKYRQRSSSCLVWEFVNQELRKLDSVTLDNSSSKSKASLPNILQLILSKGENNVGDAKYRVWMYGCYLHNSISLLFCFIFSATFTNSSCYCWLKVATCNTHRNGLLINCCHLPHLYSINTSGSWTKHIYNCPHYFLFDCFQSSSILCSTRIRKSCFFKYPSLLCCDRSSLRPASST